MLRGILLFVGMFLAAAANARAQEDLAVLGAIVAYLKDTHPDHASMEELWIREGVFDVSRHDVKHSFRDPLREWSDAEREQLRSTAQSMDLPLRFCREDCDEAPHSVMTVAFGEAKRVSAEQGVIPIQVDDSDQNSSWQTSYEMALGRSPDGTWSVTDARPGGHSDAYPCEELYGHSCQEEIERRKRADDDRFQPADGASSGNAAVEDDDYASELVGAMIGGVVSFYGLGILFGGGSLLLIIPGALIGMGIGSKF
jgi:hypothetical protein